MSAKDVAEIEDKCEHCGHQLLLVAYRWSKGDRIETEERGTPLGSTHSTSANPPVLVGNARLCLRCDSGPHDGAVQRASKRK